MITVDEIMQETGLTKKQVYAGLNNPFKSEYENFVKVHNAIEKLTKIKNNSRNMKISVDKL